MSVKIKDSDGKEISLGALLQKFSGMPDKLMNNALKAGVRAAANVVKQEAQLQAPRKSGKLAKSIKVKSRRTSNKNIVRFDVATSVYYANFIEYGASPHLIKLKNKKLLAANGTIFGTKTAHAGISAKPFMRPALDTKEGEVMPTIAVKINERLDKIARGGE
jgi:HK97 gp10 family phage protein